MKKSNLDNFKIHMAVKNGAVIIDVRTPEEYVGHPRYPRSGHIPGAQLWPWDQAVDFDQGFVIDRQNKLKQELGQLGLKDPEQPVVLYCRSGHRASHSYFTLRQLGFKNVKIYDGSMKEYEKIKSEPLIKGKRP